MIVWNKKTGAKGDLFIDRYVSTETGKPAESFGVEYDDNVVDYYDTIAELSEEWGDCQIGLLTEDEIQWLALGLKLVLGWDKIEWICRDGKLLRIHYKNDLGGEYDDGYVVKPNSFIGLKERRHYTLEELGLDDDE